MSWRSGRLRTTRRWAARTGASAADKAFAAVGIHGQHLYVNPAARVVIAVTAAQPEPEGREPVEAMAVFDAIVAALR